jgi:hypothetical protein
VTFFFEEIPVNKLTKLNASAIPTPAITMFFIFRFLYARDSFAVKPSPHPSGDSVHSYDSRRRHSRTFD